MRIVLVCLIFISSNSFAKAAQEILDGNRRDMILGADPVAQDPAACLAAIKDSASTALAFVRSCKFECSSSINCESVVVSFCNAKNGCNTPGCKLYLNCTNLTAGGDEVPGDPSFASRTCPSGKRAADGSCQSASPADTSIKPKTSPSSSAPASTGNINADMQTCQQAQQEASNCCNNPESCLSSQTRQQLSTMNALASSGNTQGLKDYCQQMNATGNSGRSANEEAANACRQRYMSCASTCSSFAQTYGSSGSQFSDIAQQCNGYQSKVQALGNQGLLAAGSGGNGNACNNLTQAQQQSTNGGGGGMPQMPQSNQGDQNQASNTNNPNDPTGCATNPTGEQCQKCTANPNDPSCGTPMQKGATSFSDNGSTNQDASGFDIPDAPVASRSLFDNAGAQAGQPAKNGTIANNTGGGVGGGGGGGGAASLGGNGKRPSPGSPGYSTDIFQGNLSGGYTTAGGSGDVNGSGGWGGYGGRGPASASNSGLDLKQFLPGHKKAPAFVGGAYTMHSAEIAGKHGDIFEKITRKFREKCMLGQLISCEN